MSEMLHLFVDYVVELVSGLGYIGIFLLMTLESSFVPFPSEVVLIPAGYLSSTGEMNVFLVCLAGIGGSIAGALINYYLSATLGRAFIVRYGKYFLLPEDKFLKLEKLFLTHGAFATFVGRLIFGIRQWISIPAGISKMHLPTFISLTTAGASIWVIILASLGYLFGEGKETGQMAKLVGYWLLAVVVIMFVAYFYWWHPKKAKKHVSATDGLSQNGGTVS